MRLTINLYVILFGVISACKQTSYKSSSNYTAIDSAHIQLTYLGTAGWEITDGKSVILIDPNISRIRRNYSESAVDATIPGDNRLPVRKNDFMVSDTAAIDSLIKRADYILVHHSHWDHIIDVPYIARKTGATVIGHESTANVMRAYGIPDDQIITVKGGEDYDLETFSTKVIPSLHSPLNNKHYYDSRMIPKDLKAPLRISDMAEGGSLCYLIRFGGHQILTSGSMNYIEKELEGLKPDVAIVGAAPSRNEIYDYAGRLMRVLHYPAIVIPTHWDDFVLPYKASQAEGIEKLASFKKEVMKASPKTQVLIPAYFKPIVLK